MANNELSIVIPSFNRGQVLLDCVSSLRDLDSEIKIVVVDQTLEHEEDIASTLEAWHRDNKIEWLRLSKPSVVVAMNRGLIHCRSNYVLFLDDDIIPEPGLITNHLKLISQLRPPLIAGRVIQPWDKAEGIANNSEANFSFNGLKQCKTQCFMGGNFALDRNIALALGGFDENFVGTAHDYERDFSDRLKSAGHQAIFNGAAAIKHLKVSDGGIRSYGNLLKTIKPHQSVGAYYFILRAEQIKNKPLKLLQRLRQRLFNRSQLKHPWWIPITFIGDLVGFIWALKLYYSGAKLIPQDDIEADSKNRP